MGANSSDIEQVDEKKVGYPFSNNPYWKMVRQGRTNDLLKEFQNGNVDCFQVIQQSSKHTILHEAIVLNRRELFKLCQVYGADWDQKDANGVTPLMKAAGLNRSFFVQKLLSLGVKVQSTDNLGRNAAFYAKMYQNDQLAQQLEQQTKVKE